MNHVITLAAHYFLFIEPFAFWTSMLGMLFFAFQLGYMFHGRFSATNLSNSAAALLASSRNWPAIVLMGILGQLVCLWIYYELDASRMVFTLAVAVVVSLFYHLVFVPYIVRCREAAATWGSVIA